MLVKKRNKREKKKTPRREIRKKGVQWEFLNGYFEWVQGYFEGYAKGSVALKGPVRVFVWATESFCMGH